MAFDLTRMIARCATGQWSIEDLDWSVTPRPMPKEEEQAIVQYFTNMAGIEFLAAELFKEQLRRTHDSQLIEIFSFFIADEIRHGQAALRLSEFYNVHKYKEYKVAAELIAFREPFLDAVRRFSGEVANFYITVGELILDIALLRSIDEYTNDLMSRQVISLINIDESRHIAIDYYMMDRYSNAYANDELIKQSFFQRCGEFWNTLRILHKAKPFLQVVFLDPMNQLDPEGLRLLDVFKRVQLWMENPVIARLPFHRFIFILKKMHDRSWIKKPFAILINKLIGMPVQYIGTLYSQSEANAAKGKSIVELAEEQR